MVKHSFNHSATIDNKILEIREYISYRPWRAMSFLLPTDMMECNFCAKSSASDDSDFFIEKENTYYSNSMGTIPGKISIINPYLYCRMGFELLIRLCFFEGFF